MKLQLYWFVVGFLFAAPVNAQVYKCTFVDEATRQNKVIYTDLPCTKAAKQTLTTIQTKSQGNPRLLQTTALAQSTAIDAAVTRAVLDLDFKLAKSLAVTKEHWRLIAIAEGQAAPQPVIVASNQAVISRVDECAQAKGDFEYVSLNSWRDKDLVAAKKSLMYVACGEPEPIRNQPIFVGQTFGGLQSGRWLHPNHHLPHYALPHPIRPHHAGHRENQHHYGHNLHSGVSLNYRSKHFDIRTNTNAP